MKYVPRFLKDLSHGEITAPVCNKDYSIVLNQFKIVEFNKVSIIYRPVYYKGVVLQCHALQALSSVIKLTYAESSDHQCLVEIKTEPTKQIYSELICNY